MCAAKVEVISDNVIVTHRDKIIGKGRGVYKLRDFNPDMDVNNSASSPSIESISYLTLELGKNYGCAIIRTRPHDTTIDIDLPRTSVGIGVPMRGVSGGIILDETYGFGRPDPAHIVDLRNNVLAIVRHQTPNLPKKSTRGAPRSKRNTTRQHLQAQRRRG